MSLSVSVVVNTLDRAPSLERTLRSFEQLDYPTFEVVVVNGPSTDHTDSVLDQWRGAIKVGHCPVRNLSVSRNIGIALSAGDVVAFIDDDAYPEPDWLDHIVRGYDDEEVAAVGGPVYDWTGVKLQSQYIVSDRFGMAYPVGTWNPSDWLSSPDLLAFPSPIGTNSSFRRDRLVALGGFDEEFEYYLDETDVICRMIDRGWRVLLIGGGFVHHKFLPSSIRGDNKEARDRSTIIKNTVYFALKHGMKASSFYEVCRRLRAIADTHSNDYRPAVDQGLLTSADLEKFERDVRDNFDIGLHRYLSRPAATPASSWFNKEREPLVPFGVLRSRETKRHVVLVCSNYPPRPDDLSERTMADLAEGLARIGHVVRVLTPTSDDDTVDLNNGVWVHRKRIGGDAAASAIAELRRVNGHRAIDVVQVAGDALSIALLREGDLGIPIAMLVMLSKLDSDADLELFAYQRADGLLALSPDIVDGIKRRYGYDIPAERLIVVQNGSAVPESTDPAEIISRRSSVELARGSRSAL